MAARGERFLSRCGHRAARMAPASALFWAAFVDPGGFHAPHQAVDQVGFDELRDWSGHWPRRRGRCVHPVADHVVPVGERFFGANFSTANTMSAISTIRSAGLFGSSPRSAVSGLTGRATMRPETCESSVRLARQPGQVPATTL